MAIVRMVRAGVTVTGMGTAAVIVTVVMVQQLPWESNV
jgi:hypothetical protein